ncbi:hypothetical protein BD626DRAFT_391822 [Schizophyllum amplum]|uniref:Fungal-type protein kinase domain-containing protein n=1 Tax=Schizophyllum amplum TaxID=97359 RepID=A0A550CXR1_9AGAR|nr:hypothetical protein BD626DRAFT_391822 [Auriculariopsis ampla]
MWTPAESQVGAAQNLERGALYRVPDVFDAITPCSLFASEPNQLFFKMPRSFYDRKTHRWSRYPDMSLADPDGGREQLVAFFLNDIYDYCRKALARGGHRFPKRERRWSAAHVKGPATNDGDASMYGVVLTEAGLDVQWPNVLSDIQVVKNAELLPEAVRRLSTGASHVFSTQDDRIYHIGLAFAGDDFAVVIHDRAGRLQCLTRKVHLHGVLLVRLVVALCLLDRTPLGRDPAVTRRDDGTRFIAVNGLHYQILERLALSSHVRGRGTVCWRCRRLGSKEDYVIKSAWVDSSSAEAEVTFLKAAIGVDGVATLVDHEIVSDAEGRPRSTDLFRASLRRQRRGNNIEGLEMLQLHRIVMQPYGRPLCEFSSKEELLSAIRDTVATHQILCEERRILHCDISDNNILLHAPRVHERLRRGLLIDLDCASFVNGPKSFAVSGHRAGTLPFMSSIVLRYPRLPHVPAHDLESFVYVLMWICANYSGPSCMRRKDYDIHRSPLGYWLAGDPKEIGHQKWLVMHRKTQAEFRAFLDEIFDPYFEDLKDCVSDLRNAVTRNESKPTHEDVLDVLEIHICAQQPPSDRRTPILLKREAAPPSWYTSNPMWAKRAPEDVDELSEDGASDDEDDYDTRNTFQDAVVRVPETDGSGAAQASVRTLASSDKSTHSAKRSLSSTCDSQHDGRRSPGVIWTSSSKRRKVESGNLER